MKDDLMTFITSMAIVKICDKKSLEEIKQSVQECKDWISDFYLSKKFYTIKDAYSEEHWKQLNKKIMEILDK